MRSLDYFDRQVFSRDTANYKVVRRNDLAYATIHLDEGSLGFFQHADIGLISPMYTVVEVTDPSVDPALLYAVLKRPAMVDRIGRLGNGSIHRRRSISYDSLSSIEVLMPPPQEQRAITGVLSAIDEAIERTEAVIATTETLRRTLLDELLTRGVPGWHTEWKQIAGLGVVPACWAVVRLGQAVTELTYGTSSRLTDTRGSRAIVALRIPNVAHGVLDTSSLKYADLPPSEAKTLALRRGDLLIVRTNGNPDVCGQSAVFDRQEEGWAFASYLLRLRAKSSILDPVFLWTYLRSASGRRQLRGSIRTSAGNYNLSADGLLALPVALPAIAEQTRIVEFVRSHADILARTREELGRLFRLKAAVADALLTGRVRVTTSPGPYA